MDVLAAEKAAAAFSAASCFGIGLAEQSVRLYGGRLKGPEVWIIGHETRVVHLPVFDAEKRSCAFSARRRSSSIFSMSAAVSLERLAVLSISSSMSLRWRRRTAAIMSKPATLAHAQANYLPSPQHQITPLPCDTAHTHSSRMARTLNTATYAHDRRSRPKAKRLPCDGAIVAPPCRR